MQGSSLKSPPEKAIDGSHSSESDDVFSFAGRKGVFSSAIAMTRMPMIMADPKLPDHPIVFTNKAFLALTGYSREEVIGRNCRLLQGADTDPATIAEIRQAVADGRELSVEILNYRKDGQAFWNALFLGPIFNDDGGLEYYFASQLDVTKRHEAEDALQRMQKSQVIGQLTSGIAHDFNNLLTIIMGNADLAAALADAGSPLSEYVGRIRNAAERGNRMVQHLLAFARKQTLKPVVIDLNKTIGVFREMVGTTLGPHIGISTEFEASPALIEADPTQLELAVLNVLVNARDAMSEPGTVTVSTSNVEVTPGTVPCADGLKQGRYILLLIADTGSGMPPEILSRVTDPYFTTKENGKGSGLGLSQVHGFVSQSNGCLAIDSRPGEGTTVRMYLPALVTPGA